MTPNPNHRAEAIGRLVELLTLAHTGQALTAAEIIQKMPDSDLRELAGYMVGMLTAAVEDKASIVGVTPIMALQQMGLNAARMAVSDE